MILPIQSTKISRSKKMMNRNKLVVCAVLFAVCCSLSAQENIKIWAGTDMAHKQKKSELTVFLPEKPNGVSIIICPGGSYCYLGMNHEGYEVAKKLTEHGFTAFVLRYRVGMNAARHPDMIQDLQRAIQLVRENAKHYQIEEEKVGLMGFSAGGHLTGTAAVYYEENFLESTGIVPQVSLMPCFTVMVYPVVTMRNPYAHKKSRKSLLGKDPSEALLHKMSLEENVHHTMPPLMILQAKDDKVVDYRNSVILAQYLTKISANHKFMLYETGGHGFGALPKAGTDFYRWFDDFLIFIKMII
jgi:acetyl esterase/lipase